MNIQDTDVKAIAADIGNRFEDFKTRYNAKNQAHEDSLNAFKSAVNEEFVKMNRPNGILGSSLGSRSPEQKTAFGAFVRKGDTSALEVLDTKSMSAGSDPDGGYAVPEMIDTEIEKLEIAGSAVMKLARTVEAKGSEYIKLVNARGTASGWVGETDARPETGTPTLHQVKIDVGEIYANPKLTQKLIDDAFFDAEAYITSEIGEEFSDQLGEAFISGNGVNKPKGILAYTVATTGDGIRPFGTLQAVETGAVEITFDHLKKLKSAVKAKYRAGAAWIMNESTALALSMLKDANGQYIWRDAVAQGDPDTLLGYPVEMDENMPDIAADSLAVAFGNFDRGYHIARRFGTRMLRDPFTAKPYVNFYATSRVGGGVVNSEAIKLLKVTAA
ncbi:MAG: HK97 family phage major capsid protein [Marinobacter psychrophilus]|jgi:HK97 family phage major capsid protein|uniref:phage major capsid protein n=1 Tax=Marinobacter psychrophilus TaxID=330734 RepID=UPI0039E22853